jgi:hypothetical protein
VIEDSPGFLVCAGATLWTLDEISFDLSREPAGARTRFLTANENENENLMRLESRVLAAAEATLAPEMR